MSDIDTIGLVETSSIGLGFQVEDAMLKAASVDLLLARTICSGKYLVAVAGDTASVEASVAAGEACAGHGCVDDAPRQVRKRQTQQAGGKQGGQSGAEPTPVGTKIPE